MGKSNGEIGRHQPLRDEIAEIPVLDILLGLPGERVNDLPLLRRRAREAELDAWRNPSTLGIIITPPI